MAVSDIRGIDIQVAITCRTVDEACAFLQDIAGITDGGVAGMCFGGLEFNWEKALPIARIEKIKSWLHVESTYED